MTKPTELSVLGMCEGLDLFVLTNHKKKLRGYSTGLDDPILFEAKYFDNSCYSASGEYSYLVPFEFLE